MLQQMYLSMKSKDIVSVEAERAYTVYAEAAGLAVPYKDLTNDVKYRWEQAVGLVLPGNSPKMYSARREAIGRQKSTFQKNKALKSYGQQTVKQHDSNQSESGKREATASRQSSFDAEIQNDEPPESEAFESTVSSTEPDVDEFTEWTTGTTVEPADSSKRDRTAEQSQRSASTARRATGNEPKRITTKNER